MLTFKTGDLFAEDCEAFVNTVNCVGVMGRGIALQFKKTYPENFKVFAVHALIASVAWRAGSSRGSAML